MKTLTKDELYKEEMGESGGWDITTEKDTLLMILQVNLLNAKFATFSII